MSNTCPTVKIKVENEQGFVIINESDFDETQHALFAENEPVVIEKPSVPWETPKNASKKK